MMAEYDTVPQEADAKQDAPQEPEVTERTDGEEGAPEKPPSLFSDCPDVGCTWPCAHHLHPRALRYPYFRWYPDLEQFSNQNPEIPRARSEMKVGMKDCQFCQIFFTIAQSDYCHCGKNGHGDHIPENGRCRCINAHCHIEKNGLLPDMSMDWTCGGAFYELGLRTAPDPRLFPYILPCMGDLHCDPVSDESVALMKGWIDNCQRCHQLCGLKPRQAGGPKRLLQCLSDGSVRLVETQSCTQRCDYIALSYCWGDGTAVKEMSEKMLKCRQSGLLAEELPPLYREVVAVARGLNIGYLWIDAVCIIQHSQRDKDEEMMKMGDIYRGALVVVVAATAKSPWDSLLRFKPQAGQSNTWRTASRIGHEDMDLDVKFRKRANGHVSTNATEFTRVGERAWCFQEKLLASRCLVFCADEVVWECRSCCLCECGGEQEHFVGGRYKKPYKKWLLPLAEHELQLDGTLKYFANAGAAYSFWIDAVRNYSGGALTLKTDRLPAISAVASTIAGARATDDHYLAGLWKNELLAGLCWTPCAPPKDDARSDQGYIAPTWSWASHPGAVFPHWMTSCNADNQATVLCAWTSKGPDQGPDPYGAVSDGAIVLSGVHCDAEMTITPEHDSCSQLDFGHGKVHTVRPFSSFYSGHLPGLKELDGMQVEPDTDGDRLGGNPYLRRVTNQQADRQPACSGTVHLLWLSKANCLILTPSHRKGKEEAYERLGFLTYPAETPKMPGNMQRSNITLV